MSVPFRNHFTADELREVYAHAAGLAELLDGLPEYNPLIVELQYLALALEHHFAGTDPLVDRQPAIVVTEICEVQ